MKLNEEATERKSDVEWRAERTTSRAGVDYPEHTSISSSMRFIPGRRTLTLSKGRASFQEDDERFAPK